MQNSFNDGCSLKCFPETKILDDDVTGNTEAGFVQLVCLNTLLVAFSCVLVPLEMKFLSYAFICDIQK